MKPSQTTLETIKSTDGNNIIYRPAEYIFNLVEEFHNKLLTLTDEEKYLYFTMLEKHGNIIKKVFGEMSDDINLIFKNSNRAPGLLFDINTIHENDEWYDSYLSWKKRQE